MSWDPSGADKVQAAIDRWGTIGIGLLTTLGIAVAMVKKIFGAAWSRSRAARALEKRSVTEWLITENARKDQRIAELESQIQQMQHQHTFELSERARRFEELAMQTRAVTELAKESSRKPASSATPESSQPSMLSVSLPERLPPPPRIPRRSGK